MISGKQSLNYIRFCLQNLPKAKFDFASSQVPFEDLAQWGVSDALLSLRPSQAISSAREALCEWYAGTPDHILISNGATGALVSFFSTFAHGTPVAVESPGYEGLASTAQASGAQVMSFDRENIASIDACLKRGAKAIVLTNPHNPSGRVLSLQRLAEMAELAARHGAALLVDESFIWFSPSAINSSAVHLAPNVFVISSLSKAHGMGQIRFGWLIGHADRIQEAMIQALNLFGMPSTVACTYGIQRIRMGLQLNPTTLDQLRKRQTILEQAMADTGSVWCPPDVGLFGLLKVADTKADEAAETCLDRGILVAPGRFFGAPACLRVSFGCYNPAFESSVAELADILQSHALIRRG